MINLDTARALTDEDALLVSQENMEWYDAHGILYYPHGSNLLKNRPYATILRWSSGDIDKLDQFVKDDYAKKRFYREEDYQHIKSRLRVFRDKSFS